jgi:hypothetical protein
MILSTLFLKRLRSLAPSVCHLGKRLPVLPGRPRRIGDGDWRFFPAVREPHPRRVLINIMMFVIIYFFSGCYRRAGAVIAVAVAVWAGLQFQAHSSAETTTPFLQYLADYTYNAAPWIAWGIIVLLGAVVFLVRQLASGDRVQVQRYIAMVILFLANACFWALFEQAGVREFLARDLSRRCTAA